LHYITPSHKQPADSVAEWYSLIFPLPNRRMGSKGLVYFCHIYRPKHLEPFGAYHGVIVVSNVCDKLSANFNVLQLTMGLKNMAFLNYGMINFNVNSRELLNFDYLFPNLMFGISHITDNKKETDLDVVNMGFDVEEVTLLNTDDNPCSDDPNSSIFK